MSHNVSTWDRPNAGKAENLRPASDADEPPILGRYADMVNGNALVTNREKDGKTRQMTNRPSYVLGNMGKQVSSSVLHHISIAAKALTAYARVAAREIGAWAYGCYAWSLFAMLLLFGGALAALLHKQARARRILRISARILLALTGVPLSVKGLDRLPAQPHILLVNHSSFLDAIVLTALLPSCPGYAFTVRQQYASQALLWPLLRVLGTLVFKHSDKQHTSNVNLMTAALTGGESVVVFPEGGFTPEPGLKPFHTGAFVAAAKANVPIVVAGLRGARTALPLGTWLPRRTAIALEVGPTFLPGIKDEADFLEASRAARSAMVLLAGEAETPA